MTMSLIFITLLSCDKNQNTLFEQVNPAYSNIHFSNTLVETESQNITTYFYFYNGAGVAIGDINNDNLPDLYFASNQGDNKLYLNKGDFKFEDITLTANVGGTGDWSTGVSMIDINGDGHLDVYVCQVSKYKWLQGRNLLYINNGDLTFTESAEKYGLAIKALSTQANFFDYDRDGDLDMYLLCHSVHSNETFVKASARQNFNELSGDRLFENQGDKFIDVSKKAGIWQSELGYGLGISIGDINNDQWPDIYVSNDFHENDYLYYNKSNHVFSEHLTQSMGHTSYYSMGNDLADINNDGRIDVITLDMKPEDLATYKQSVGPDSYDIFEFKRSFGYHYQYASNALQLNMGNDDSTKTIFSDIAHLAGVEATDWSWSSLIADYDLDGWKDLFISNGINKRPNNLDYLNYFSNTHVQANDSNLELVAAMPDGKARNYCYQNNADLTFTNVANEWGLDQLGLSNGAAYADLDDDGDLDLVVNNINSEPFLLKNHSIEQFDKHYLKVQLKGSGQNKYGLGARVMLYSEESFQTQELFPVKGFMSSVDYSLVFGLEYSNKVDSVIIRWPTGGKSKLINVSANQTLIIEEERKYNDNNSNSTSPTPPLFEDITSIATIEYNHVENVFNDMNREKLIPQLLSTQGPTLAIADVNGDGLEDFYVGGAKNQAASLFIQHTNGEFSSADSVTWKMDILYEDVDAAFFDADNDGDQDLYVVSGGNESAGKSTALLDRLYINEGNGQFRKSTSKIPDIHENGSCIKPCDFDLDGDVDLFIGTLNVNFQYGMAPKNYLLVNDSKGNFTIDTTFQADQMVSDGTWGDIDNDGDSDLIIVGPWFPITIYLNEKDHFSKSSIPYSEGLWNTIESEDLDNDGDMDFVLGNIGLNSPLNASRSSPMQLFVGDFDQNYSIDPILTFSQGNNQYPLYHKDELVKQLNFIRKKYPKYQDYAVSTINELLTENQIKNSTIRSVYNLNSVVLKNNGTGDFSVQDLPIESQFSTIESLLIEDINGDNYYDILIGGNFHHYHPALGRQDASYGWVLMGGSTGHYEVAYPTESNFLIRGQVRDLKLLNLSDKGKGILIGRNNDSLKLMRLNSK